VTCYLHPRITRADCRACQRAVRHELDRHRLELFARLDALPQPPECVHGVRTDRRTVDDRPLCPICRHAEDAFEAIRAPSIDYAAIAAGEEHP
jgi:hypothetical protein